MILCYNPSWGKEPLETPESRLARLETIVPLIHDDLKIIKTDVGKLVGFRLQVTTIASLIAGGISAAWATFLQVFNHS